MQPNQFRQFQNEVQVHQGTPVYPNQQQQNQNSQQHIYNYPQENQNVQQIQNSQSDVQYQQQQSQYQNPQVQVYQQSQQGYQPQSQYQPQMVQPMQQMPVNPQQNVLFVVPTQPTSRFSQAVYCNVCKCAIESQVKYETGPGSVLIGGLIACAGFIYGCCLIPCFIDDCKDAVHMCPQCQREIGKKKFIFSS